MSHIRCRWLAIALLCLPPCAPSAANTVEIDRNGQVLELQIYAADAQASIRRWADHVADALTLVYGHWPRDRWRMRVYTIGTADARELDSSRDVIPWAQVNRGTVDTATFYVLAGASTEQLNANWTGYHELAHLLIPYRGWGDMGFSEGLAAYYQNLLQVRAGQLSEQQMWQKLYEGFERGLADTAFDGIPLSRVSRNLRQNGGYMRVYWSGVRYFLDIDHRLRQESGGAQSLDTSLTDLNACCADKSMSVPQMVERLDALTNTTVFSAEYQRYRSSTTLPDYRALFASLGLIILDGKIELADNTPGARLRSGFAIAP